MTEQLILIAWAFKYTIHGSRCVGESRALDRAVSSRIFKMYPLKANTKQETLETETGAAAYLVSCRGSYIS
jgi:hypothetical protein